jgi:MFS family permease
MLERTLLIAETEARARSPWLILLYAGSLNLLFALPVVMAYYSLKGIDLGRFLVIQGLYRVAITALEIPTGYLSDGWTRRKQLILCAAVRAASLGVIGLAGSFWLVTLGELLGALSVCLWSGTAEAYLYEALQPEQRQRVAAHWQGYLTATVSGSAALAAAIGPWLFARHVQAPILATLAAMLLALVVAQQLPDVPRSKRASSVHALRDMLAVARWCLVEHPRLRWLLLGPGSIAGFTLVLFWALQPQLSELGASPQELGWATAGYFVAGTTLSISTGRLTRQLGEARLFVCTLLSLLLGSVLFVWHASIWTVWLGILLGGGVVHFTNKPLTIALINHHTPDESRATVISVFSMVSTLVGGAYLISAKVLLGVFSYSQLVLVYLGATLLLSGRAFWQLIVAR